ncbi:DUF2254 domain-containing protein [Nonomuraea sp. B5E05]|uniref:DUF2254 domain-containing protein n=1 Tax=Nonomuraea sp. B5E05 TaxID=3153569 RepID=UPI0032601325
MNAGGKRRLWKLRSVFGDVWSAELWPLPAAGVLAAIGLGTVLPRFDADVADELPVDLTAYLFGGGPEAARAVLSAIASSLITVTSLTFSLTVVTLQLASSQYSPRLLRTFTSDRVVHIALTILLSTFVYSVTVLRTVRASLEEQSAFVPHLSVTVAYALVVVSVITLVVFLAHLARQIRVESLLRTVHSETRVTIRENTEFGRPVDSAQVPSLPADGVVPLCARSSGFLTALDDRGLTAAAVDAGAVVFVHRLPGESLITGIPVAAAWALDGERRLTPDTVSVLEERLAAAVRTGYERTATQDVAFGLRQIVDIALRALSPGINDPTTAVHALSHASALLCELAGRALGPRLLRDGSGQVRVVLRGPDFPMLLELVMAQPRHYAAGDPDVLTRLFMVLREVAWSARGPEQRAAVAEQLVRLRAVVSPTERARADRLARSVWKAMEGQWESGPH